VNIHGSTGYLADVGDVESMADYAVSILSDDEKHAQFRKNALDRAKVFSLEKVLPQYEDLYVRTLASVASV
jgi:glycosyltransferase involved in cell wall biosynthesis